jgi:hypothetical protein
MKYITQIWYSMKEKINSHTVVISVDSTDIKVTKMVQ